MDTEKIIENLIDCFRGRVRPTQSLELALQLLAWAKLSVQGEIPSDLSFNENKITSAQDLTNIFKSLNTLESINNRRYGFRSVEIHLNDRNVLQAVSIVQDVHQAGLLTHFEIPESFYTSFFDKNTDELAIPEEIVKLMINLAGSVKDKEIYCPYDNLCQFTRQINSLGGIPSVEVSTGLSLFWLTVILTETPITALMGEPVTNPQFIEKGKLKKFDISIAFPPIGIKANNEIVERDLYNRFPEKTSSWSILAIRHILAQTKERAIIGIPNNLLFSSGAEKSLREDLLQKGLIESVISLPSVILPSTAIKISILVLNVRNKSDTVQFIDSEKFSSKDGRGRSRLTNLQSLLESIKKEKDESIAVTVTLKEILDNDCCLEVSRYLRSPERKKVEEILNQNKTELLENLVDIIRPPSKFCDEKEGIEVREITINDFAEYGYTQTPNRDKDKPIYLDEKKIKHNDWWLRPDDIVIPTKGSVGKIAIISDSISQEEKWIVNQSCLILRVRAKNIDSKLLFMYLSSKIGQHLIKTITTGATIPLIQLKSLREMPVIIPSDKEAEIIINIFDKITQFQKEIKLLKNKINSLNYHHWSI